MSDHNPYTQRVGKKVGEKAQPSAGMYVYGETPDGNAQVIQVSSDGSLDSSNQMSNQDSGVSTSSSWEYIVIEKSESFTLGSVYIRETGGTNSVDVKVMYSNAPSDLRTDPSTDEASWDAEIPSTTVSANGVYQKDWDRRARAYLVAYQNGSGQGTIDVAIEGE